MLKLVVAFIAVSWHSVSWGQTFQTSTFDVIPSRGALLSNVVIDSQVTTGVVGSYSRIKMHLSCYATNLRGVSNPVAANALVTAYIDTFTSAGVAKIIQVQFPAEYLKPAATRLQSNAYNIVSIGADDPGTKISAYDNIIQLLIPNLKEMTITSGGEVANVSEKNLIFSGIRFSQAGAPDRYGPFFGSNGPLSASLHWYTSIDGKTIDVYASFPGAATVGMRPRYLGESRTGFCGGYYSPLMLFFDDSLPNFTATSDFSLASSQAGKIYWPEKNSPGYFLVLDSDGKSEVKNGDQLFGDTEKFENGFKKLAFYDENKDGVIDIKDKVFKQLNLWNDKDADGVAQKNEMQTLKKMGVVSIDLKFINETKKFGDRAEYKEKSAFKFKKAGIVKSGVVLDVWFSPAPIK